MINQYIVLEKKIMISDLSELNHYIYSLFQIHSNGSKLQYGIWLENSLSKWTSSTRATQLITSPLQADYDGVHYKCKVRRDI